MAIGMGAHTIQVVFLGQLRVVTGSKTAEFAVEETETINTLLTKLIGRFGEGLRKAMFDEIGELRRNLIIRLDGENIDSREGLGTRILGGREVIVMTAVSGG
jgi:molybdopterin converting factor small subunit